MREDGRIGWSEKVDEYAVENVRLFRRTLEDADERRLLLDAVEILDRPLVWYLVGKVFVISN